MVRTLVSSKSDFPQHYEGYVRRSELRVRNPLLT